MRESTLFETIAARLLARQGIGAIWQVHLRASASHLSGNWLAAAALIGIADAAERRGRIAPGRHDPNAGIPLWVFRVQRDWRSSTRAARNWFQRGNPPFWLRIYTGIWRPEGLK